MKKSLINLDSMTQDKLNNREADAGRNHAGQEQPLNYGDARFRREPEQGDELRLQSENRDDVLENYGGAGEAFEEPNYHRLLEGVMGGGVSFLVRGRLRGLIENLEHNFNAFESPPYSFDGYNFTKTGSTFEEMEDEFQTRKIPTPRQKAERWMHYQWALGQARKHAEYISSITSGRRPDYIQVVIRQDLENGGVVYFPEYYTREELEKRLKEFDGMSKLSESDLGRRESYEKGLKTEENVGSIRSDSIARSFNAYVESLRSKLDFALPGDVKKLALASQMYMHFERVFGSGRDGTYYLNSAYDWKGGLYMPSDIYRAEDVDRVLRFSDWRRGVSNFFSALLGRLKK